jgi:hypothetical protein
MALVFRQQALWCETVSQIVGWYTSDDGEDGPEKHWLLALRETKGQVR